MKVDTNTRFEDYPFIVPTQKRLENKLAGFIQELKECGSARTAKLVIKHYNNYMEEISNQFNVIYVLYSIETTNKAYKKAMEKMDELSPIVSNYANEFTKILVKARYRKDLELEYGKFLFKQYDNALKTFDEKIIPDLIQENKLTSRYDEIMGGAQIKFRGEVLNLTQLGKYTQDIDRETRKEAAKAMDKWLSEHDQELGDLYGQLVQVRTEIAKKLGFKSFTPLAYLRLGRTDYDPKMVKGYRDQITASVTPLTTKLYKQQAKRLGIKHPQYYDYNLMFTSGNPSPIGNKDVLVKAAKEMYEDMGKETNVFFNHMLDCHLMDLEAKPGKAPGGYCTYFPLYKTPFVFSNFNGTQADVNVLTHEFGHGLQMYLSADIKVPEYRDPTMETAEIHSMSMEFFSWPYMEKFFGDQAEKYRYCHLVDAIEFLPYGISVDEFQHWVYDHPKATHEERCKIWREIELKNCPHKVYDDTPTLEKGRWWLRQSHIFTSPFYYIDYTLAQVVAFQFLIESRKNHAKAWKKYIKLCKSGGKYPYTEMLRKNDLRIPFEEGNVEKVIKPLEKILKAFDTEKM